MKTNTIASFIRAHIAVESDDFEVICRASVEFTGDIDPRWIFEHATFPKYYRNEAKAEAARAEKATKAAADLKAKMREEILADLRATGAIS